MRNILLIFLLCITSNLLCQNNITAGETLSYKGNSYLVASDTLSTLIRQQIQSSYPEYISIQRIGNTDLFNNDFIDDINQFCPYYIDSEEEIRYIDVNLTTISGKVRTAHFLMWHNDRIFNPRIENIMALGKIFYEILPDELIQIIEADKNWPKEMNILFRCTINSVGKTGEVQILIPKKSYTIISRYLNAEIIYNIEQALINNLAYPNNLAAAEYMREVSLKYFPYKMEDIGYYLAKYKEYKEYHLH